MPAGAVTPSTTPTTMMLPGPAPARYPAEPNPSREPGAPPPGVPIDMGEPLIAWHADESGAGAAEAEGTPTVSATATGPAAGNQGAPPPPGNVRADAPPEGWTVAPEVQPAERTPPAGPLAGKGKLADSGGKSVKPLGGPAADRPLRGPAAAILHWFYGQSSGGGRQVPPGRRLPTPGSTVAQQVGRAPGLPTRPAGAATASY